MYTDFGALGAGPRRSTPKCSSVYTLSFVFQVYTKVFVPPVEKSSNLDFPGGRNRFFREPGVSTEVSNTKIAIEL